MDAPIRKLVELLQYAHKRPKMFFTAKEDEPFKALVPFTQAYLSALPNGHDDTLGMCLGSFHKWLMEQKSTKGLRGDPNVGWPGMISLSYPNEQERFEAFFKLLDEFITTREI